MKKIYLILVIFGSISAAIFAALAFMMLAQSFSISELDDVRLIQLFGFPSILISSILSSIILLSEFRRLSFFINLINTASAALAFIACFRGIVDFITLTNRTYHGHQGNNFMSLDLFVVGTVPLVVSVLAWFVYCNSGRKSRAAILRQRNTQQVR
jgi:hypothetical protein